MPVRPLAPIAAVIAMTIAPTPAFAHAKLVAATPAANASVTPTRTVTLTFSAPLAAQSGATLVMTGMPGMANHPDMKMPGVSSAVSADGKSIVLTSAKPIPAGSYRVDWVAVGTDSHRITGTHVFSVR